MKLSAFHPAMVDTANGEISREIFTNAELYQEELEKLFTRAWLFIGHESQIPNDGDFFLSRMGSESVIMFLLLITTMDFA